MIHSVTLLHSSVLFQIEATVTKNPSEMPNKWEHNEEIQILQEYLRIPSVHPDIDYGNKRFILSPFVHFLFQSL